MTPERLRTVATAAALFGAIGAAGGLFLPWFSVGGGFIYGAISGMFIGALFWR